MADRNSELKLSYAIDQAKQKQSLKAISQLRDELHDLTTESKKLALTNSGLSNEYTKFSAKSIQARNEILKGTKAVQAQVTVLERLKKLQSETPGTGSTPLHIEGATSQLIQTVFTQVGEAIDVPLGNFGQHIAPVFNSLKITSAQLSGAIGSLTAGAALAIPAVVGIAVAVTQFSQVIEESKKRLENAINSQKTYYQLIATGTREQIQLGIEELKVKRAVAEQTRRDIQAGIDRLREQGALGAIDKFTEDVGVRLNQAFGGQGKREGGLISSLAGLTDQAKATDEEIAQLDDQLTAYERALNSVQVATNTAAAAHEEYAAKLRANNDEQNRIRQQAAEQEAAILQRTADQRIAIARRTAEQEEQALLNLQRALADDRSRLGQAIANARLNYQRQEAQSARQHYRNLLKIRKDAEANEFELILNRDFLGLARLRRETDAKLAEEEDRNKEERRQRLTALKHQLQDQQKAYVQERQQRIKQYNQQLSDLRAQQIREIKANDEAARVDLDRLHARLTAELAMKADAYSAILELERQYVARLRAMHGESSGGNTPINTTKPHEQKHPGDTGGYAFGGVPPLGKPSLVNEKRGQVESFSSGGRSVMLPGGMGMFTPFRPGRINSNGGGINISMPITVNGSTLAEIRRKLHSDIDTSLAYAFEALTS